MAETKIERISCSQIGEQYTHIQHKSGLSTSAKWRDSAPQKPCLVQNTVRLTPSSRPSRKKISAVCRRALLTIWNTSCLKMKTAMYSTSTQRRGQMPTLSLRSTRLATCSAALPTIRNRSKSCSLSCSPLTSPRRVFKKNKASLDRKFRCATMTQAGGFSSTPCKAYSTTIR